MLEKKLIASISKSYSSGKSIRRNLGLNSKLVVDQKIPYCCVYRFSGKPDAYLTSLLQTQGAYLILNVDLDPSNLLETLIDIATKDFKSFLIFEIWDNQKAGSANNFRVLHPTTIVSPTVKALQKGLMDFKSFLPGIGVKLECTDWRYPENFPPLINIEKLKEKGALLIGIAVPQVIGDAKKNSSFPLYFRMTRRKFAETITKAAFEFTRLQADTKFEHYLALGKTKIDSLLRAADKSLAAISEQMDFLMKVTPVNAVPEWENFKKHKFKKLPEFNYRLITIDPEIEKRKLFSIPIEKIEHPTLAFLLREKRMELEKQLVMLEERGTKQFIYTSQSLYGPLHANLKSVAMALLNDKHPNEEKEITKINAYQFAEAAELELDKYRESFPQLKLSVKTSDHVSGLIVSGPELHIGSDLSISSKRLEALIQHEVGTHILTWCNGHRQPLHLMYAGFAGYEQLQEGMAVFAEYLAGGLTINRLKILAARVMAVDCVTQGANFIETFHMLRNDYGFTSKTAFNIAMRVHRGGGYTKDAIYLKGLIQLMEFIKEGGNLALLYGGKFALEHLPMIKELIHLKIIKQPILPGLIETRNTKQRIATVKKGVPLHQLVHSLNQHL